MLSLGAKIPLYFWRKQKPAVEQAALERESARERLRASNSMPRARSIATGSLEDAGARDDLYREALLPQARATFESAIASYRTGRVDFQTVLSASVEQLSMNEEYYRAIIDREIAIAHIEQMIGKIYERIAQKSVEAHRGRCCDHARGVTSHSPQDEAKLAAILIPPARQPVIGLTFATVKQQDLVDTIRATGTVEPTSNPRLMCRRVFPDGFAACSPIRPGST